ncbi:MAG: hypothetical protein ACXWJ4_04120 [Methyloceanibacter sp.]
MQPQPAGMMHRHWLVDGEFFRGSVGIETEGPDEAGQGLKVKSGGRSRCWSGAQLSHVGRQDHCMTLASAKDHSVTLV